MSVNERVSFDQDEIEISGSFMLHDTGVFCPKCDTGHKFGNISISSELLMGLNSYTGYRRHIIEPDLTSILPLDPEKYDLELAVEVICSECGSKMVMVPAHILNAMESLHSFKFFTGGVYFELNPYKQVIARSKELHFRDINFVLTALLDRVEFENIELNPVSFYNKDEQGTPYVWEFDVGPTKDQDFWALEGVQIVRNNDGHTGYIRFSLDVEESVMKDTSIGELHVKFNEAIWRISDLLDSWSDHIRNPEEHPEFNDVTSDPFREFYRAEYLKLVENDVRTLDSYKWFKEGHTFNQPPMYTESEVQDA